MCVRVGWRDPEASQRAIHIILWERTVSPTCPYPCAHRRPPLHQIPCGHAYCRSCLAELRAKDVPQTCPLCRAELPPGLDGLYDLGFRAYKRVSCMVERGEISWASLPAAEQEEMDEAVAMLTEASSQVW